jgi:hypothetical protein
VFGRGSEVHTLSLYHFFRWLSQQSRFPPGRDYNCCYWLVGFPTDVLPKANRFYHELWGFLLKNTTKPRILRMVATPWGDKLHSFSRVTGECSWLEAHDGYMAMDQNLNLRPPADHFLPLSLNKHATIFLGVSMSRIQNFNWWVMKGVIPPGYIYLYICSWYITWIISQYHRHIVNITIIW